MEWKDTGSSSHLGHLVGVQELGQFEAQHVGAHSQGPLAPLARLTQPHPALPTQHAPHGAVKGLGPFPGTRRLPPQAAAPAPCLAPAPGTAPTGPTALPHRKHWETKDTYAIGHQTVCKRCMAFGGSGTPNPSRVDLMLYLAP